VNSPSATRLAPEEWRAWRAIAVAAIRYFMLKFSLPAKLIVFDIEER